MAKYIDAEKLIKEIKIIQQSLESRNTQFKEIERIQTDCMKEFCKCILDVINSLQQEPQEVDLEEELEQYARNHPADDAGSYRNLIGIAHHFYELGKNSK